MDDKQTITILGKEISFTSTHMNIHKLRFYEQNPRVYSKLQENASFEDAEDEEKQRFIEEQMKKEPSVKNLISDIERQGGVMEPVVVLHNTEEVLEGNSRLAALRALHEKKPNDERWWTIPCSIVSPLEPEQIDAYLHEVHVKGKTPWLAYEKAYKTYKRVVLDGISSEDYADWTGETTQAINKQIATVELMKENNDRMRIHWSYYDVLMTNRTIRDSVSDNPEFKKFILEKIKKQKDGNEDFTALEMREKLPVVLKKPKILKKFMKDQETLDEAFRQARSSSVLKDVRSAYASLNKIEKKQVIRLDKSGLGAVTQELRKCKNEVVRLERMIENIKKSNAGVG